MGKQFTLGRHERLKSRKLIEQLFSEKKSFAVAPFRVHFTAGSRLAGMEHEQANIQCGFGASSKNFKRAVDRNRIKRLTREAWRLQKQPLVNKAAEKQQQAAVFLVYTGRELPGFDLVKSKLEIIINKLIAIIDETAVAAS